MRRVLKDSFINGIAGRRANTARGSLVYREAFCLFASAHLLTTEGVCVIEYFTAESNRLVALGGTIYSFSK